MAALATSDDVETRLGRILTDDESAKVDGLLAEATALVVGHLGCDPTDVTDPETPAIPAEVTLVVSRIVARVLEQSMAQEPGAFGATSMTDQIGDFSQSRSYPAGSTSGGPWLSRSDKVTLKAYRCSGGTFSVDTAPSASVHSEICALVFGALYCSCGADINGLVGPLYEV